MKWESSGLHTFTTCNTFTWTLEDHTQHGKLMRLKGNAANQPAYLLSKLSAVFQKEAFE